MAKSTAIWENLRNNPAYTVYHPQDSNVGQSAFDGGVRKDIEEQAYQAFLSAIRIENRELLAQEKGNLRQFSLNLSVSPSARKELNYIWDYYANRNKL